MVYCHVQSSASQIINAYTKLVIGRICLSDACMFYNVRTGIYKSSLQL